MSAFSSSDGIGSDPSTHEESLSALSAHGGRKFSSSYSRYVIHTHTVPLATTVDQQYLLDETNSEGYFHGFQAGEKDDIHCPLRSCMYIGADRRRKQERLRLNCPCMEVALENGSMKPLCFLVYVRALNRNLTGTVMDAEPAQNIDPAEVMFCQTSTGVFDNSYSGPLRDKTNVTGWGHVTDKTIIQVLDCLYWFRKFQNQYGLRNQVRRLCNSLGVRKLKHIVMQSMHTINSLLVKKMIAFSPEIEGYTPIAKHTAWAFSALLKEYGDPLTYTAGGLLVEPTEGFYIDTKNFCNFVKASFHKEVREDRYAIFHWRPTSKSFGAFFGTELRRLQSFVDGMWSGSGSDYTLSPAWVFRATTLAQTRGMGYLPDAIAECRRQSFRNTVNRETVIVEPEMSHLQALAVKQRLHEGGIPPLILSNERIHTAPKEEQSKFEDAMSRIEMPIKGTASYDTYVKDGGKIEDARLLLSLAKAEAWQIPVRDLETHDIREFITVPKEHDEVTDISRYLFWISYQLFLNHWIKRSRWDRKDYHPFYDRGVEYEPPIMNAKIVHISEPGKERNLTKSHATLAWLLTPGAKLAQGTLAMLPEHRAGLLESGHEWRHQKRISSLSDESGFIYDGSTGKVHREIRHVFKDWTESTDFICKSVGYVHLRTFFDYVGFPRSYARLILLTVVEPQPVVEVLTRRMIGPDEFIDSINWNGSIREGFMMGNPITKVILHLVHESERAVAILFLKRRGLRFVQNTKFWMYPDRARLDREKSSHERTTVLQTKPLLRSFGRRRS